MPIRVLYRFEHFRLASQKLPCGSQNLNLNLKFWIMSVETPETHGMHCEICFDRLIKTLAYFIEIAKLASAGLA